MYRELNGPLAVQVEITDGCNEACSHCYRSCQLVKHLPATKMQPSEAIRIIDELATYKVFSVAFTGGEPLLCPKTLISAIKRAKSYGIICNVNTNLQLLTNSIVDVLVENNVRVLTSIISVNPDIHDSVVSLRGAHSRLVRNIRTLTSAGVRVSANMVVRSDNAHQVYDTGVYMHELGIRRFSATKAAPTLGIDYESYRPTAKQLIDSLDTLLQLKDELGISVDILESYPLCFFGNLEKYKIFIRRNCTAGIFNCSISPNGDVRPCSHADMKYGNIFLEPLRQCWSRMNDWRAGRYIHSECRECPHLYDCTGGCRIDAKILSGDICGRDPLMTHPSNVIPLSSEPSVVDLPEELKFSCHVLFRNESFGGILKKDDDIVFLTQETTKMVTQLLKKRTFHLTDLDKFSFSKEDRDSFFAFLYDKGMVVASHYQI